jgi:hypothetical protein
MAASPKRNTLGSISPNRSAKARRISSDACAAAPATSAASSAAPSNPYTTTTVTPFAPSANAKSLVQKISRYRWGMPNLRPNQEYALSFVFENTSAGGTALLVDRTGSGKSHVMIQRRGRGGRQGQDTTCHLIANVNDFLYTAIQIQSSRNKNDDNAHLYVSERELVSTTKFSEFMALSSLLSLNLGC